MRHENNIFISVCSMFLCKMALVLITLIKLASIEHMFDKVPRGCTFHSS